MFCKRCGKQLNDSDVFCTQCGTKVEINETAPAEQPIIKNDITQQTSQSANVEQPTIQPTQQTITNENVQQENLQTVQQQPLNQQPINQQFYQNQPVQNPVTQTLGMKWYKFLIYFSLFASAVLNFSTSLMYFTGEIHNINSETARSEWVYAFYPSLKGLDVFFGVVALVLCVGAIFVRFQLAKFKKNGPLFYFILIGINIVTSIIYIIAYAIILADVNNYTTTITISPSQISGLIGNVVILILNIIYFNKRKHLFVNH